MIIFGSRGVTRTKESGPFACPGCGGTQQTYTRKIVRRFFTLYFVPIIPLDKLGEYLECQRCRNTYNEQVLNFNPAEQQEKKKAEFVEHLKRIMILAAVADGRVDDEELEVIRDLYKKLTGTTLGGADLERELAQAGKAGVTPGDYSRRFAGELNEHGKELVIKSVHSVLAAGGSLGQEEHEILNDLAEAMDLSGAHFRGILAELDS